MARYLVAVGDPRDAATWSGIPHHLLKEAQRRGVLDGALPTSVLGARWIARRAAWNLMQLARARRPGGYQYSVSFLEELWRPYVGVLRGHTFVNCFQLYAPSLVARSDVRRWYFLDQTLRQLFSFYGVQARISSAMIEDAIRREAEGYATSAGVIVNSRWASDSLARDYGVPAEKVHVVVPGANLDHEVYDAWLRNRRVDNAGESSSLKLVFVGKDPHRKGLDRLLRAITRARCKGADLSLRVIGCAPEAIEPMLRGTAGVEWIGFVSKTTDGGRYLDLVGSCDVGCLLSRAEAGGIALREYHALGLAVLAPKVGGSPDHVIPDASILVEPDASDDAVAEVLMRLSRDRSAVARMKSVSWAQKDEMGWAPAVTQIAAVLNGSRGAAGPQWGTG